MIIQSVCWLIGAGAIAVGLFLVAREIRGLTKAVKATADAELVIARNLGDTDVGRVLREVASKPGKHVFSL